jgi:hypothetical protein
VPVTPSQATQQPKALPASGQVAGVDAGAARGLARLEADSRSSVESEKQRKELIHHQAVIDALSDDRVGDEASFQRAVKARQLRAERDYRLDVAAHELDAEMTRRQLEGLAAAESPKMITGSDSITPESPSGTDSTALTALAAGQGTNGSKRSPAPRRWAADDKDYPISTDRASAVARWVMEAPPNAGSSGGGDGARRRKKKPAKKTVGSSPLAVGAKGGDAEAEA